MSEAPTPSASSDVVAVLNAATLAQVFAAARPMNASVQEGGELMEHPLEDGSVITDHLVDKPIEIAFPVIISGDYKPVLDEIRQTYRAGTLLTVQTRAGSYQSMVLFDFPHEETTDQFDTISVLLKFREARFIKPTLGKAVPRAKKHAATTKRGQVQPKTAATAAAPRGSFLFRHIPVR